MKMTLKEANRLYAGLAGTAECVFPPKLGYTVSYNMEKLREEVERGDAERKKICEAYAEKDEDGNAVMGDSIINGQKTQEYIIPDGSRAALEKEYMELMETEVDADIRMAKFADVERCETSERYSTPTVSQMQGLLFMLEE